MSRGDDRTIIINLTTRTFSPSVRSSLDFYISGGRPRGRADAAAEKKPRQGALTAAAKRGTRPLSRVRVRVEPALAGVTRARSVKAVVRNPQEGTAALLRLIACGLPNLRVRYRKRRLKL